MCVILLKILCLFLCCMRSIYELDSVIMIIYLTPYYSSGFLFIFANNLLKKQKKKTNPLFLHIEGKKIKRKDMVLALASNNISLKKFVDGLEIVEIE